MQAYKWVLRTPRTLLAVEIWYHEVSKLVSDCKTRGLSIQVLKLEPNRS